MQPQRSQRATTPELLPQQLEELERVRHNNISGLRLCPGVPPCQGELHTRFQRALSVMSSVTKEDRLIGCDRKHLKQWQ